MQGDKSMTPELKAIVRKMLVALTLNEADMLAGYLSGYMNEFAEEHVMAEIQIELEEKIQTEAQEQQKDYDHNLRMKNICR